jgi:hypothetical protein
MSRSRLIIVMALSLTTLPVWAADKSLVLYLPLDEGAGRTARDVSSYNNPGTIVGNAAWAPGVKGTALQFVSGSRVTIPEIPEYDVTAAVSLLAWVKTNSVPNWARVIDKSQWQTTGFDLVLTQNVGLARLEFFVNNTTSLVDSTTVVANNEWHFLVGTFGNKTLRIYVDGKREGESPSAGQVDINPNNWPLMIGAESSSNGGQQYFGSIDEVAMYKRELAADEIMNIFQGGMPVAESAADPAPKNGAVDVPRDVVLGWTPGGFAAAHDVYLGTSLADVNNASRTNPLGVLSSQGQSGATFDPDGLLEYGKMYYWRVDEVNAAPDNTIFKGEVWSFTAEPFAYPVTPAAATASGSGTNMGPQNTINGSGLNAADQHSTESTKMWISNGAKPAWIQYEFDKVYKLAEMWVWNANQEIESMLGFGAKDVTIEYSVDGQTWKPVAGVPEFAQAPGAPDYAANTTVDLGGVDARFVKLTVNANWGGVAPQVGLSEVRFFYVPIRAFAPQPADKATNVSIEAALQWRPGREAESHQVYLGTDRNALALADTTAEHSSIPAALNLATTYYWRIDEVGGAGPYEGDVWSFTTEEYVLVDDFERYSDAEGNRIYEAWVDGFTTGSNGSQVGYDVAPFAEKSVVHGGLQSLPLKYNNSAAPNYSEGERTFNPPQDWTQHGITTLVLYFRGQVTNTPAPLYLKINGTKVPFGNDAATAMPVWRQWAIPLAATGANLKSVKSLTIGVEGGGKGTVFVDDIRLYAAAPQAVSPADPGATGLVALYTMDGNVQDTSGKNYHGTIYGTTSYEAGYAGQALVLNGSNAYVDLPIGTLISSLTDITVATHVFFGGGAGAWQRIFDFGSGTSSYMFLCPRQGTSGNMRFGIRSATVNEQIANSPGVLTVGWHHVAVALDGQARTITLYVDGERIASGATAVLPRDLGKTTQNWIGRSQYAADAFLLGSIDDFRIYSRALSAAEVRYLAGDRWAEDRESTGMGCAGAAGASLLICPQPW